MTGKQICVHSDICKDLHPQGVADNILDIHITKLARGWRAFCTIRRGKRRIAETSYSGKGSLKAILLKTLARPQMNPYSIGKITIKGKAATPVEVLAKILNNNN